MSNKYWPRTSEELAEDPIPRSLVSQPPLPANVGSIVPVQRRSLHAAIVQSLKDVEGLIARLEAGVDVADSGRALIRDLYVQCRKQREILAAVRRLELE